MGNKFKCFVAIQDASPPVVVSCGLRLTDKMRAWLL